MKTDKKSNLHKVANNTSKNITLYDGPSMSLVYDSFMDCIKDLINDLGLNPNQFQLKKIELYLSKFLKAFRDESESKISGSEVKEFADLCKARRSDLLDLVNDMTRGKAPAFPGDYYIISNDAHRLDDISYYPNSFKGVLNYLKDVDYIMSYIKLKQSPGFYVYLHKMLFTIISSFNISEEFYDQNEEKIIQILLLPVSLGQVYERMNPTPDVMEVYAQELLEQLRNESKDPSQEFWDLFNQVALDIKSKKSSNNIYVHNIIDALYKTKRKVDFSYRNSDYYLTAKASTIAFKFDDEKNYHKVNSLFSSIIEVDNIKDIDEVRRFDNYIGYQSGYWEAFQIPENLSINQGIVITSMIPNPGKYKPRGIHIGMNSIQDRCKYLHRIWAYFLNLIDSCCMIKHIKGVEFLKRVSLPQYRQDNMNNIFVSDFSNATDTLNQEFQCKVIEVLFGEIFSDFWKVISKLPKKFRHPIDKQLEDYIQMTGQPQGLLGSFDAFSMAHIYLICMLMKKFHMEKIPLSETAVILGDDSVVSYPQDRESKGLYSTTFYEYHSWLCQEVSLIKNDSKTGKSFFDSTGDYSHKVLDFAKISIRDGVFITPIPYGLLSSYSKKRGFTDIQLTLWLNSKGLTYNKLLYSQILRAYNDYPYEMISVLSIVSSGEIGFLKEFKNEGIYSKIDRSISGLSLYSFYINQLKRTFLSSILSDSKKDKIDEGTSFIDKAFKALDEDFYNSNKLTKLLPLVPCNHKYNIMLQENMQLAEDLQTVLSSPNLEELSTNLAIMINEDYKPLFEYWITLNKEINKCIEEDDENIWQLFSYQDYSAFKDLSDPLKNFQIKSMTKESSNSTKLLKSSAKETFHIIKKSRVLSQDFIDCITPVIQELYSFLDIPY